MPERKLRQLVHDCTTEYQIILSNMEQLLDTIQRPNRTQRQHVREIREAMKKATLIVHNMQSVIAVELGEKAEGQA